MAVVETIKIEGDASEFNEALKDLNTRIESLEKQLSRANTEIKEFGDKGEKSIKGVKDQVKETGKSIKDLVKNLGGLAIINKVAGAASEAFTGNQKVVDVLNTGMFAAQIAVSNLIDFLSGNKSLKEAFTGVLDQAKELVELQKEAALGEAKRIKIQLEGQKLAEEQRQIRDDETKSIKKRQQANEQVNKILNEQLQIELELVQKKVDLAKAEKERLDNIDNEIALIQAETELIDVQERIAGQRSEYLSNQNALRREAIDLQRTQNENDAEALLLIGQRLDRFVAGADINLKDIEIKERISMEKRIQNEYNYFQKSMELRLTKNNERLIQLKESGQTETQEYEELLRERFDLEQEYGERTIQYQDDLRDAQLESMQIRYGMVKDGLQAIGELSAAFAGEDEASKKAQFEFQKKLSLASAIVSGIEAVQNAYKTAQASPYTAINPAYPSIQAGLAGVFAAAQVAAISRTQFESSSLETTSTTAPSQPAQFNIVGQSGTNQLVEGLAGQFDKPIRAYVVSGEVISAGELDRRRLRTATFP
jgi:hypothetical protein